MNAAPYTTDGDLTLDPRSLADTPQLGAALEDAGFKLTIRPGTWSLDGVQIDLLVPSSLSGGGRRGARLGVHGSHVARKADGLEAAIVDHSPLRITSLHASDPRAIEVNVAGVGALLVSKLLKIAERVVDTSRLQDKDALDVLRLLQFMPRGVMVNAIQSLSAHPLSSHVTRIARGHLIDLFSSRSFHGVSMLQRAVSGLEDPDVIARSCEVLTQDLLRDWDESA